MSRTRRSKKVEPFEAAATAKSTTDGEQGSSSGFVAIADTVAGLPEAVALGKLMDDGGLANAIQNQKSIRAPVRADVPEDSPPKIKIAILGGGVAGLSAAHELAKFANFEVHVLEKERELGGKARSQDVSRKLGVEPNPNDRTTNVFLGEHGFRLFPHFYKHITQTLKEIPFSDGRAKDLHRTEAMDSSVWGNLRGSTEGGYADGRLHKVQRPFPATALDFTRTVRELMGRGTPATHLDIATYSWYILKFLTACQERRDEEYDRFTWAEFVGVGTGIYTSEFEGFVRAAPRNLSAMWPDKCSARSCGGTLAQMTFDFSGQKGLNMDAVLTGPTTETWLDAWKAALESNTTYGANACDPSNVFEQVKFHPECELVGFTFDGNQVTSAIIREKGELKKIRAWSVLRDKIGGAKNERVPIVEAVDALPDVDGVGNVDYFICAVPLEVAQKVFAAKPPKTTDPKKVVPDYCTTSAVHMEKFDGSLRLLNQIEEGATAPMVGLQFFLRNDVPICHGHVLYPSSPWALTSVSQAQFWEKQLNADDLKDHLYRRGTPVDNLRGVLSVIISDWDTTAPRLGRRARDCTPKELKREVWLQLTDALERGEGKLRNEDLLGWKDNDNGPQDATPVQPESFEAKEQKVENDNKVRAWDDFQNQRLWKDLDAVLLRSCHLDDNLQFDAREISFENPRTREKITCSRYVPKPEVVSTPLFVHPRGSQRLRPDAQLRIPNLLLASDYVRTYTDLATMEAANEAARRAVLAILQRETVASSELYPKLWPLTEGQVFEAAKALDRWLYLNGQAHIMDSPEIMTTLMGTAFDNVFQTGLDFLGLRNRIGLPPDMARRVMGVARGFGSAAARSRPEMLPKILTFFTSSFLSSLRWE